MGSNYNPRIITDGLVLCLDAANPRSYPGSGTSWNDLSGNGNHATLLNGPVHNQQGYLVFDGIDDGFTANMNCNKQFYSLDWWIYPLTRINYNQNILFGDWGTFVWHTGINGEYWAGTDISTRMAAVDSGSVEVNKWQNWTWTFNNGFASMYKNGNLLRTKTMNVSAVSSFTTISSSTNTSGGTNGYRSSIKVYSNKVLTETEIRQNFEATRDRYGI